MSDFETIIYEKKCGVAHITLNRPDFLNVYNLQMRDELYQILGAIKDDSEIRAVILRGAGKRGFCAGADLSEFLTAPSPVIARHVRWARDVWGLFLSVPQPTIAALHGFALGSGLEMASCCDLRIASDDTQFGYPEAALGALPAAGGTQTLPRIVGRAHALNIAMAGDRIGAEEALRIGLINRITTRNELIPTVEKIADIIVACSPRVLRYAKEAIYQGLDMSLDDGMALEKRLSALSFAGAFPSG